MAELDAVARLRFISDGARSVVEDIERIKEGTLDLDKGMDRAQKTLEGLAKSADNLGGSLGKAGRAAGETGREAGKGAKGWEEYQKALTAAQQAERKFAQDSVASKFGPDGIPAVPASKMSSGQRQNLLGAYDADNKSVIAEARRLESLREKSIQAEFAAVQKMDDERKRAAAYLAKLKENSLANERAESERIDRERLDMARQAVAAVDRASAAHDTRVAAEAARNKQTRGFAVANASGINSASDWDKAFRAAEASIDKTDAAADRFAARTSPRLRYALYDVSTTALITAGAITAVGAAVGVMAAKYESAFTNVERTLDGGTTAQVAALREELIGLTREIPVAFGDVAQIATLGNQLGVASGDIATFTETVAKFSAVTGLTAEAAAQAFGGLGELLNVQASEFENLGSSIALVGRRSVATEQEIVAMTTRLAASATKAGFTAEQVVALSGAFASLRIAPERAQGVMEVYFNRLNTAIATGNESLDAFAHYAGVATEDVAALVQTDPVGFFERLATGLGTLDSISQTTALQQLGLDGIRAGEVFGRVAGNVDVFNQALADSNQGWVEGAELGRQYSLVVDDLASKWQIFMNAVGEAGAAVGTVLAPAISTALEILTKLMQGFAAMADNPFGQGLIIAAAAIGGIVAALAALIGSAALASASLLAIRSAAAELFGITVATTAGLRGMVGGMLGLTTATGGAAVGLRVLKFALISTGIGAAVVAIGTLAAAFLDWGETLKWLQQPVHFIIDALLNIAQTAAFAGRSLAQFMSGIPLIGDQFKALASVSDDTINSIFTAARSIGHAEWDNYVKDMETVEEQTDSVKDATIDMGEAGEEGFGQIEQGAQDAVKEVRTLVDYANDLSGVFKRSFDIRFGGQQGLDRIASGWNAIKAANDESKAAIDKYREGISDAADAIRDLRQEIASLTADRKIKQYWLSIAQLYGDDLRAGKLGEEISEINNKIADSQKGIKDEQKKSAAASAGVTSEQEKLNRSLEGNSEAAINNRAALLGIVDANQQYLTALAASGASQGTIASEAARLKREFIDQATQMGFSRDEAGKYALAFDDMALAIQNVPRNVTVDANTNPAMQALNELRARLDQMSREKRSVGNFTFPKIDLSAWGNAGAAAGDAFGRQWKTGWNRQTQSWQTRDKSGNWVKTGLTLHKDGGYTGNGSVNDVAGLVHGQEFVMSAPAVRNAGGPNAMAYMHQMLKSGKGFMPMGGGMGSTRWDPADIDTLARAIAFYNPGAVIPGIAIQKANSMSSATANAQGRN